MSLSHKLSIKVPFENPQHPQIVINTLTPDPLLKATDLKVDYSIPESTVLQLDFSAKDNRALRLGVNSLLESLKLCVETIDEFE